MALLLESTLVSAISGKVSNDVYIKDGRRQYVRGYVVPTHPGTPKQNQATGALANIQARWPSLTDAQRKAWVAAAEKKVWEQKDRLGRYYRPSGAQLFIRLNMTLAYAGLSLNDPPEPQPFPNISLSSYTTTPDGFTHDSAITFTANSIPVDFRILLFTTANKGAGVMKSKPSFFRWTNLYNSGDIAGPLNYKWSYFNTWGALPSPTHLFLRAELICLTSGQRSLIGAMPNF